MTARMTTNDAHSTASKVRAQMLNRATDRTVPCRAVPYRAGPDRTGQDPCLLVRGLVNSCFSYLEREIRREICVDVSRVEHTKRPNGRASSCPQTIQPKD